MIWILKSKCIKRITRRERRVQHGKGLYNRNAIEKEEEAKIK